MKQIVKYSGLFLLWYFLLIFGAMFSSSMDGEAATDVNEGEGDYAYFRAHPDWGTVWSSKEGTFRDKQVVNVLARVGTQSPFITTLQEKDMAELLNFFNSNGWEVVSHDTELRMHNCEYLFSLTCILKRKNK